MDTKLHILTTAEHVLRPVTDTARHAGSPCVVYSKWGIASIGPIQPGFHIAYLPLSDIKSREMATAPVGTKLLLKSSYGCWRIGVVTTHNRGHFTAWAPLPKLSTEIDRDLLSLHCYSAPVEAAVRLFVSLAHDGMPDVAVARQKVSTVRTLMLEAMQRPQGDRQSISDLLAPFTRRGLSDRDAFERVAPVLPFICGANGPYDMTVITADGEVCERAQNAPDGDLLFLSPAGKMLGGSQVYLCFVRRDPPHNPDWATKRQM